MVCLVNPKKRIINGSQAREGIGYIADRKGRKILLAVLFIPISVPKDKAQIKAIIKAGTELAALININFIRVPSFTSSQNVDKVFSGEGINHLGVRLKW